MSGRGKPSILERILDLKREEVREKSRSAPFDEMRRKARDMPPTRGFRDALAARVSLGDCAVIAEIKKASPSRGVIRENFDVAWTARRYEEGGATALSVLTDAPFFQGQDAFLGIARGVASMPVLRKEFILDPWQVYESRVLGADCLLLIVAALRDTEMRDLHSLAMDCGLDVLVEVHDEAELERAKALDASLVGVNNRNLHGFETSLEVTKHLAPKASGECLLVAESGIRTRQDIDELREFGVSAFLVGESLMAAEDPGAALASLLAG